MHTPPETLVIGDIGGEFDALMELVKDHTGDIILVGDLNDRGPKSRQVIEWAMSNPKVTTLDSNHGHMFADYCLDNSDYSPRDFLSNGGLQTLVSYGLDISKPEDLTWESLEEFAKGSVPMAHIEWLNSRPIFVKLPGAIVSHAPIPVVSWMDRKDLAMVRSSWIWNRNRPVPFPGVWQIFGHNASWGLAVQETKEWVCIDDSRKGLLTGILWPSKEIRQVRFRDIEQP